jgi:hypothetical protein
MYPVFESGSKTRRQRLLKAVAFSSAALGWVLFSYWWWQVARETDSWLMERVLVFLFALSVIVPAAGSVWIWHNLRLAGRGKRGLISRYQPVTYSADHLGRELVMCDEVRGQREVAVAVSDEKKSYKPAALTKAAGHG